MTQKTIETSIHQLQWPNACCKCGSPHFTVRTHAENVVSWTVVGVTAYRNISISVPVCNRCFYERYFWYGAAVAITAMVLAFGKSLEAVAFGGVIMGSLLLGAVGLGFLGTRRQPLNMLSFNVKSGLLTLRVYNGATAKALLASAGAKEVEFQAVRRGYLLALGGTLLVVAVAIIAHLLIR